jgi:RIO kinase 1
MRRPVIEDASALSKLLNSDEFKLTENFGRKTQSLVFDSRTIKALYEFLVKYKVDYVDYPISSGKESVVFKAQLRGKPIALKIYKMSTLKFQNIRIYIDGDYRFANERLSRSKFVYVWARKEYSNLLSMTEAGIRCPKPIAFHKNLLAMSFIGTKQRAAPQIKDAAFDAEPVYREVSEMMRNTYREAGIVHADLSEYNILYYRKRSYFIDVAQGVTVRHPSADIFLRRDVNNITQFFIKKGVDCNSKDLYSYITEE